MGLQDFMDATHVPQKVQLVHHGRPKPQQTLPHVLTHFCLSQTNEQIHSSRRICWIIVTCACNCSPLHIMITSRFRIPFFLGSRRLAFFQYMVIRVDSQVSVYVCSIIKRLATSSQHWRPAVGVARKQLASSFQSCALHQQP